VPNRSKDELSPPRRSHGRDESVRRVSRVTRTVGVLAVLGTVVAGGLAASGRGPAPSTARTAGTTERPVSVSARPVVHLETRPVVSRHVADDDAPPTRYRALPAPVVQAPVVQAPVAPPAPVVQAPVASSGGS
jgi:hypothetical protein